MSKTLKFDLLNLALAMVLTVMIIGYLTNFRYTEFEIQLHDTYIILPKYLLITFIGLWTTLILFSFGELVQKFSRQKQLVILITLNTVTLMVNIICGYVLYSFSTAGGLIDASMNNRRVGEFHSPLFDLINYAYLIFFGLSTVPIVYEFFLIIRFRRLKETL